MKCFLHADLDAFYASVEQLDHREYRGKPLVVGGLPGDRRSVVSTASYEARVFGVHSAMPIAEAVRLCPHAIFLRGNMKRYREKSDEVMAVFANWTPDLRQISIDEAFLDMSGTEKLFGSGEEAARKIKDQVRRDTGLTVSIGGASNKYVAKIASGMSKPDGLCVIPQGGEESFMLSLPVGKIWGAGAKTQDQFKKFGLKSCADIHRLSLENLKAMFGEASGLFLYRAVRGEAAEPFDRRKTHSMSAEQTFDFDLLDEFALETALFDICHKLMYRLLSHDMQSSTLAIKIRYADFSTEAAQETFAHPLRTVNELFECATGLFNKKYHKGFPVRLLGASLMNLAPSDLYQGDLFDEGAGERTRRLEKSILEINRKFPASAVRKGRTFIK